MQLPMPLNMPHYPALRFVSRHGRLLVWTVSLSFAVLGVILVVKAGTLAGLVTLIAAGIFAAIGRLVVELIELISDMLLPRLPE